LKLIARTKIKTSITVLALVLFLAGVTTFLWVLADSAPQVPLAGRVLYRTNDPSGQMRYVILVTNLTSDLLLVQLSSASFTNRIWSPTQAGPFVLFDGFDLRSHNTRLIAAALRQGAAESRHCGTNGAAAYRSGLKEPAPGFVLCFAYENLPPVRHRSCSSTFQKNETRVLVATALPTAYHALRRPVIALRLQSTTPAGRVAELGSLNKINEAALDRR
jgi:hypothetical protein